MSLKKIVKWAVFSTGILLLTATAYVALSDLGRHRELISLAVTKLTGRQLTLGEEVHLRIGRSIHIAVDRLRLQNALWSTNPDMLDLQGLNAEIDLVSIFDPPVRISRLELVEGMVFVEHNSERGHNWSFGNDDQEAPSATAVPTAPPPVVVESLSIGDLRIEIATPRLSAPLNVGIESLSITANAEQMLALSGSVRVGEKSGDLSGEIGPLPALISGEGIRLNLGLQLPLGELHLVGSVASLETLTIPGISLQGSGPDIATLASTLHLPPFAQGGFDLQGSLRGENGRLDSSLKARLGDLSADLQASISPGRAKPELSLSGTAGGPNLGNLAKALFGIAGLPEQPFTLDSRIRHDASGTLFEPFVLESGGTRLSLEGRLGPAPSYEGTRIEFDAAVADIAAYKDVLGHPGLGQGPIALSGRIEPGEKGFDVSGAVARIAGGELRVDGQTGRLPRADGLDLRIAASLPDLQRAGMLAGWPDLPKRKIQGSVRILGSGDKDLRIRELRMTSGGTELTGSGKLRLVPGADGSSFKLNAGGEDFSSLGDLLGTNRLPRTGFQTEADFKLQQDALALRTQARIGETRIDSSGRIGLGKDLMGSQLEIRAQGPDLRPFLTQPDQRPPGPLPFELDCAIERTQAGIEIKRLIARGAKVQLDAQGTWGTEDAIGAAKLSVRVAGRSLAETLAPFTDQAVPAESFEARGQAEVAANRLSFDSLSLRLGENRATGKLEIELTEPAKLSLRLGSNFLDLRPYLPAPSTHAKHGDAKKSSDARAIPDIRVPDLWSDSVAVDGQLQVSRLLGHRSEYENVEVIVAMKPGLLQIDSFRAERDRGTVSGSLVARAIGGGIESDLTLRVDGLRWALGTDPRIPRSEYPPWDGKLKLVTHGRTLRELLRNGNGRVRLVLGNGKAPDIDDTILTSDFLVKLAGAIDPFAQEGGYALVDCGFAEIKIQDGKLQSDTFIGQTNKLLIVAHGSIDLATEAMNIEFVTKPREGLGISANVMSPFVYVSGTLSVPTIRIDKTRAAISGVAAYATGGLSLLAEGLFNRVSAAGDVCGQELARRGIQRPGKR